MKSKSDNTPKERRDRSDRQDVDMDSLTLWDAKGNIVYKGRNSKHEYDRGEHRHRFAVWAAARAVQRGFTTTKILRHALYKSGVRSVITNSKILQVDAKNFETLHRKWCRKVATVLKNRGLDEKAVTYGRAAKLVAVYLKTIVVMSEDWNTPFGRAIHPPIDRILLHRLASLHCKPKWRSIPWTRLDENGYYELVQKMRELITANEPFWLLERYWQPSEPEDELG